MGNNERESCGLGNNCVVCLFRNLRKVWVYKEVSMNSEKFIVLVLVVVYIYVYKYVYVTYYYVCLF